MGKRINEFTVNQEESLLRARKVWENIKDNTIITQSNYDLKKFFYTIDHCQAVIKVWQNEDYTCDGEEKNWLGNDQWVACTTHLPYRITPRPAFPDGWIKTREEDKKLHYSDYEEISNPESKYQP